MRIKAKANAMENVEVEFVSLVSRPATRIPFRALKSEDSQETDLMIHLSRMFKRDGGAAQPQGCTLAGIVLQKQHAAHFEPQIAALGLKIDDKIEDEDVIIYRQVEYTDDAVTAIKLSEVGGLFLNTPESVQKQFDPFPEGTDFKDNMAQGGFFPGVHVATDVMLETVRNVLRTAEDGDAAKAGLGQVLKSFSDHILSFVDELPAVAFKLDAMTLEGFVEPTGEGDGDNSQSTEGDGSDTDTTKKGDEGAASSGGSGETEAEAKAKAAEGGELTDEQKLKAAGVHVEGMPSIEGEGEPAKKAEGSEASAGEGKPASTEKSEEKSEQTEALAALVAKMSEVLEAVSGVRKEVGDLKSKQDELAEEVKEAASKAEAATKAVKGTVPSNNDAGDESLGTHRRSNQKADTDDQGVDWTGTGLDRIVGEFGGSR